eukprot:365856-Chlamydomonas_euryale.AAC.16
MRDPVRITCKSGWPSNQSRVPGHSTAVKRGAEVPHVVSGAHSSGHTVHHGRVCNKTCAPTSCPAHTRGNSCQGRQRCCYRPPAHRCVAATPRMSSVVQRTLRGALALACAAHMPAVRRTACPWQ